MPQPQWHSPFEKEYLVGLDVGSFSVKLVRFARRAGGLLPVRAACRAIPGPRDGPARDEALLGALREVLAGVPAARCRFVASVNDERTAVRCLKVPAMPQAELAEAMRLESRKCFPFAPGAAGVGFDILATGAGESGRFHQVALAAAPVSSVERVRSILSRAGVSVDSVLPASFALAKLAEAACVRERKPQCFIDIGDAFTELVIHEGGPWFFSRKMAISGAAFTKALTGALASESGTVELGPEEAEKLKREVGVPGADAGAEKISSHQILSLIRPALEELVKEIERSFDYCHEEHGSGNFDPPVLFGGGALLKNLAGYLSKELGTKVIVGDPFKYFSVPPAGAETPPVYAVSAGLGPADRRDVNLLPVEVKQKTRLSVRRGVLKAAGASTLLLLLFAHIGMKIESGNLDKKIAVARMELAGLSPRLHEARVFATIASLAAAEPRWDEVLNEFSNLVPDNVYFTEFGFAEKAITVKGVLIPGEKKSGLSEFIAALEGGILKETQIVTTRKTPDGTTEFELKCRPE